MANALNIVLPVVYTAAYEWSFRPVKVVTVTVTNGPAMATFVPYSDPNMPYNGQAYENQEREMTLSGKYGWDVTDFNDMLICGIKLRSLVSTQLATVSFNA